MNKNYALNIYGLTFKDCNPEMFTTIKSKLINLQFDFPETCDKKYLMPPKVFNIAKWSNNTPEYYKKTLTVPTGIE